MRVRVTVVACFTLISIAAIAVIAMTSVERADATQVTTPVASDVDNRGTSVSLAERADSSSLSRLISAGALDPGRVEASGAVGFRVRRTGPLRPDGDVLAFVSSRLPHSNAGDGTATYEIFLAVLDCQRRYGSVPAIVDHHAAERLAECESLLGHARLIDADWLSKAVEQGSFEAKLLYSISPEHTIPGGAAAYLANPEAVQRWRERSLRYLEDAVSQGSLDAMLMLSAAYGAGVLVEQDRVLQLAYALASETLSPISGFDESYAPLRRSLTSVQQQEAELRARNILDNCCKD